MSPLPFIIGAYAATAVILLGLVAATLRAHRQTRRRLEAIARLTGRRRPRDIG